MSVDEFVTWSSGLKDFEPFSSALRRHEVNPRALHTIRDKDLVDLVGMPLGTSARFRSCAMEQGIIAADAASRTVPEDQPTGTSWGTIFCACFLLVFGAIGASG